MYKKIIILGGSGSGKSTLANRIGLHTGYEVFHLDGMLHDSKWQTKDKGEWEEIFKQFLLKDSGVVDGNYSSYLDSRIKWADLIIFIDIPTNVKLYRIFRRYFKIKLGLEKRHGFPDQAKHAPLLA